MLLEYTQNVSELYNQIIYFHHPTNKIDLWRLSAYATFILWVDPSMTHILTKRLKKTGFDSCKQWICLGNIHPWYCLGPFYLSSTGFLLQSYARFCESHYTPYVTSFHVWKINTLLYPINNLINPCTPGYSYIGTIWWYRHVIIICLLQHKSKNKCNTKNK